MQRRWTGPLGGVCLALLACSPASAIRKTVPYVVRSDPPGALIAVDGQPAATTPATITFFVSRWWVGWYSPDGWAYGPETYTVTARPPPGAPEGLTAATQVIRPGQSPGGGELFFNLRRPLP